MPNPEALGPASLAVGQAVGSFSVFLPKFTDVRQSAPGNVTMQKDVRLGEFAAATMSIGIGVILSSLSGSPAPAVVSIIMAGVVIALYEQALRNEP